jgi:hypothetical protein
MAMRAADLTAFPERAMLDANVLLAATDEGRAEHGRALSVINEWPGAIVTINLADFTRFAAHVELIGLGA